MDYVDGIYLLLDHIPRRCRAIRHTGCSGLTLDEAKEAAKEILRKRGGRFMAAYISKCQISKEVPTDGFGRRILRECFQKLTMFSSEELEDLNKV